jgi:hypothetical protein
MEKKVATQSLMHSFSGTNTSQFFTMKFIAILLVIVLLGIGTGYVLSAKKNGTITNTANLTKGSIQKGQTYGSNDTQTFKDTAEGVMKNGGIGGEGQYHLERPGGASQNVYLTSSIVDLSLFIDHTVKVWGQTQTAQKAGWLMDVGKVEVEQ